MEACTLCEATHDLQKMIIHKQEIYLCQSCAKKLATVIVERPKIFRQHIRRLFKTCY